MKYVILICDGMADYPVPQLNDRTPMQVANKSMMDALAAKSFCGTVSNVPQGMVPESDTANLGILSYDPAVYSRGRSPLEALSMGLDMQPDQTAFRCNLVALSEDCEDLEGRTMIDHSADEITTEEADQLIRALQAELGNDILHFYTGVSYRHCILWKNAPEQKDFARPHDILGQTVRDYLPPEPFLSLMKRALPILAKHPVNVARRARGLHAANSIWLWSPGKKPSLPSFSEKWGLRGSVISAVDLIKGIGICAGMDVPAVEGATGNVNTNYEGKAQAALDALRGGADLVYIHVEAPDECGHRAEVENKVLSIEYIDQRILKPIYESLSQSGEPFRIMVLPDHPTPIVRRTHTMDPVPYFIYDSEKVQNGVSVFTEETCAQKNAYNPCGHTLMAQLTGK